MYLVRVVEPISSAVCFDTAKPYLDQQFGGMEPYVRFVGAQLFIVCHLSSESSLILVREAKEWDDGIINRSVVEGTIKYAFLMSGEESEVRQKGFEYWEQLPNFSAIRHHDRALAFLKKVANPDDPEWIPFKKLLLTHEEIYSLRNGTNKKDRSLSEQPSKLS